MFGVQAGGVKEEGEEIKARGRRAAGVLGYWRCRGAAEELLGVLE